MKTLFKLAPEDFYDFIIIIIIIIMFLKG